MGMPLKISDDLVHAAREEAKVASRSATGQIEHWAKIGRAVELVMTHTELLGLKSLHGVFASAPRREEVKSLLERLVNDTQRDEVRALIRAAGGPVYETDPAYPGQIIQVSQDGTRKVGRLKGRRFVSEETLSR